MLACSWLYILFVPKLEEYELLFFNDNILKFDISIFFLGEWRFLWNGAFLFLCKSRSVSPKLIATVKAAQGNKDKADNALVASFWPVLLAVLKLTSLSWSIPLTLSQYQKGLRSFLKPFRFFSLLGQQGELAPIWFN